MVRDKKRFLGKQSQYCNCICQNLQRKIKKILEYVYCFHFVYCFKLKLFIVSCAKRHIISFLWFFFPAMNDNFAKVVQNKTIRPIWIVTWYANISPVSTNSDNFWEDTQAGFFNGKISQICIYPFIHFFLVCLYWKIGF